MTSAEFTNRLSTRASVAGLTLEPEIVPRLYAYYTLLATWNQKINVTAMNLTDLPSEALDRLFIEPIAASRYAGTGAKVIDIGSGGGSPAIPFALASHAESLTMVESRSRKSVFLREAARAAGIQAEVVNRRFQSLLEEPQRLGSFDVLTIRAVRIEASLVSELFAFLVPDGCLLHFHTEGLDIRALSERFSVRNVKLTERATLNIVKRAVVPRGTSGGRIVDLTTGS